MKPDPFTPMRPFDVDLPNRIEETVHYEMPVPYRIDPLTLFSSIALVLAAVRFFWTISAPLTIFLAAAAILIFVWSRPDLHTFRAVTFNPLGVEVLERSWFGVERRVTKYSEFAGVRLRFLGHEQHDRFGLFRRAHDVPAFYRDLYSIALEHPQHDAVTLCVTDAPVLRAQIQQHYARLFELPIISEDGQTIPVAEADTPLHLRLLNEIPREATESCLSLTYPPGRLRLTHNDDCISITLPPAIAEPSGALMALIAWTFGEGRFPQNDFFLDALAWIFLIPACAFFLFISWRKPPELKLYKSFIQLENPSIRSRSSDNLWITEIEEISQTKLGGIAILAGPNEISTGAGLRKRERAWLRVFLREHVRLSDPVAAPVFPPEPIAVFPWQNEPDAPDPTDRAIDTTAH